MRNYNRALMEMAVLLALACAAFAQQQPKPQQAQERPSIATVLNRQLSNLERELVPAVEAMPEDKFSFAPTSGEFKGVRDFARQAKHVAAANYLFASTILGEKPLVEGEDGPAAMKSKSEIVKLLKNSFEYSHKAFSTIDEKNVTELIPGPFGPNKVTRLGMATLEVAHGFDHYGQIVEYLRMNGIIPPASRQQ